MRVEEVAKNWKVSNRLVYRFIEEGLLPASVKPRDRPILGYEVDDDFVAKVKKKLRGVPRRGQLRRILKEV